jgi:hypothetical protein
VADFHRSFLADNPAHEPENCSLFARLPGAQERVWWRKERHHERGNSRSDAQNARERDAGTVGSRGQYRSAAETCASTGNIDKAIEIALDVEQLIYEVNTFLNAASMINRISKT